MCEACWNEIDGLVEDVRSITPDGPADERLKKVLVKILELLKERG